MKTGFSLDADKYSLSWPTRHKTRISVHQNVKIKIKIEMTNQYMTQY